MRTVLLALIALFLLVICVLLGIIVVMLFEPGPSYRPPQQREGAPIERPN